MNGKSRLVVNLRQLTPELKALTKQTYPNGFKNHLMKIPQSGGRLYRAYTLETEDTIYLVKVDADYLKSADEILNEVETFQPDEQEDGLEY